MDNVTSIMQQRATLEHALADLMAEVQRLLPRAYVAEQRGSVCHEGVGGKVYGDEVETRLQ